MYDKGIFALFSILWTCISIKENKPKQLGLNYIFSSDLSLRVISLYLLNSEKNKYH